MGDMNWDDPKMPGGRASPGDGWRDAWEEAGSPKAEKTTCGRSWRFDRCFVLATSDGGSGGGGGRALGGGGAAAAPPPSLRVARVGLVGREQVGTLTVPNNYGGTNKCKPSDHLGLLVTLSTGESDDDAPAPPDAKKRRP